MRRGALFRVGWPSATLFAVLLGCGDRPSAEIEDPEAARALWHAERLTDLRAEGGWLAVVGLHWLSEGEQTVGWGDAVDVRLAEAPVNAPETLARVKVTGSEDAAGVTLSAEIVLVAEGARLVQAPEADQDKVEIAADDGPASEWSNYLAAMGAQPIVVEFGSFEIFVIERGGELALRVRNRSSPARQRLADVALFDYDPNWVVTGRFEPADGVRELAIDNSTDHDYPQRSVGRFVFEHADRSYSMELVGTDPSRPQLLMVADETNAESTYGGGRYLYVDVTNAGTVVADFNRLYNPPCVFTPYATCPLPPRANQLALAVEAGEKYPTFLDAQSY